MITCAKVWSFRVSIFVVRVERSFPGVGDFWRRARLHSRVCRHVVTQSSIRQERRNKPAHLPNVTHSHAELNSWPRELFRSYTDDDTIAALDAMHCTAERNSTVAPLSQSLGQWAFRISGRGRLRSTLGAPPDSLSSSSPSCQLPNRLRLLTANTPRNC